MPGHSWNWRRTAAGVVLGLALALVLEAARIEARSRPFVHAEASALPTLRVALVLGCSPRASSGRNNEFFVARMAAAAKLFHAGKAGYLLLSGDNSSPRYDEPTAMKRALEALGVPSSRLVLDYAGFRTLDSVVRAKQVFGVTRLIVVSQRFHNLRAVYLARAHGIEAYGFDAAEVRGASGTWREAASRLFAVLDVHVLHTEPRFPGPRADAEPLLSG